MSTRSSIAYDSDFHFYHDLMDQDDAVYLRLRGNDLHFEASPGEVTLKIPAYLWEHIRMFPAVQQHSFQIMSNEELTALVEREVDARIDEYVASGNNSWVEIIGCGVYGLASSGRDEQIELATEYYKKERIVTKAFLEKFNELNQKLTKYQLDSIENAAHNMLQIVQTLRQSAEEE